MPALRRIKWLRYLPCSPTFRGFRRTKRKAEHAATTTASPTAVLSTTPATKFTRKAVSATTPDREAVFSTEPNVVHGAKPTLEAAYIAASSDAETLLHEANVAPGIPLLQR
nr:uncharacterized protein LOC123763796 [Procambarus clarkii]